MPRIRKRTSKRGTTRQRERIKHKISEHHKKAKKQARKDKASGKLLQKKSKKDPGIPNAFPYKDQILAEVAEQRRQTAEARERRKEERRAAAAAARAGTDLEKSPTPGEDINVDVGPKDGEGFDGIMSLTQAPIPKIKDVIKEQTPSIPVFPGPSTLREVVQKADVVLHVLDARDPAACISEALVEAAQGKLTLLLNKADMVPRESLVQWLAHLRVSYTVLPFRASSAFLPSGTPVERRNKSVPKDDALGLGGLWAYLDNVARTKNCNELVVAMTGVTNAGKSAVVNSILGSEVFSVYDIHTAASAKGPHTTTRAQEVVALIPGNDARKVRFIDTPGLQFVRAMSSMDKEREATRARDILLRSRGRIDRLKDPLFGVAHIVMHGNTQDLMLAYSLPAFLPGDAAGFLAGLARVSGLIKKRGALDHAGAARIVLRDWSTGKLMRYSMPGVASGLAADEDGAVLGSVKTRKELRAAVEVKLMRMEAGASDKRDVEWDVEWGGDESGGDESGDEENGNEEAEDGEDGEDDEDDDGDDDEEEEEAPARAVIKPGSRSGKRKVSFAVETKGKRRR